MADDTHEVVAQLEAKLSRLHDKLKQNEVNLIRSAEIGKGLLEDNIALENRMQVQAKDHRGEIEELEQQKYSLQLKLEQKSHMESVYVDEIEGLKHSLKQQEETLTMKAENEYQPELTKLKTQVCQQQTDLDRLHLCEKQLKERNAELEKVVDETREQLQQKVNTLNETCSEEMAQLHSDLNNLQGDKLVLLREIGEAKDEIQQYQLQLSSTQEHLSMKENEVEERQCQVTSYYNTLEKSREENLELKAEIDLLRMESQDQKRKGNSLFSEVEDRRVEAEKILITLKVEYGSLRKQYEASRQNLYELRMKVAGLLQSSSGRADNEHVESLQQQLRQKNEEVYTLMGKLQKYEKEKSTVKEQISDFQGGSGFTADTNYIEYIQVLTDNKQKVFDKQQEELRTKSLQLLAEEEKVMTATAKLYSTERMLESLRAQNYKLQVQVEELRLKYEPDKFKTSKRICKGVKEQIPLTKLDLENITKQQEETKKLKDTQEKENTSKKTTLTAEEEHQLKIKAKKENLKEQLIKMSCDNIGVIQPPKVALAKKHGVSSDQMSKLIKNEEKKKRKVTISDENQIVEPKVFENEHVEGAEYNLGEENTGQGNGFQAESDSGDRYVSADENTNMDIDNGALPKELEAKLASRTNVQKSSKNCPSKIKRVPKATTKLGDDPNECKNQ